MTNILPPALQKLIDSLSRLPGIGKKSAQRLAYSLLRSHRTLARDIGESLQRLDQDMALCPECFLIADHTDKDSRCAVCRNARRDQHMICVVEHVFDAEAIECSGEYTGLYHVLHGRISPLDDVTPEDIKMAALIIRVKKMAREGAVEVVIATNPNAEGETTAMYIQNVLQPLGVNVTRIATGIPVGSDVEYADEVTLARAMKGRQKYT